MSNQPYSLSSLILDNIFNLRGLVSPYGVAYKLALKQREFSSREFGQTINRMQKRKLLVRTEKNNQKFIKLTRRGELEVLFQKAGKRKQGNWDGKWRLFIFDIPEGVKEKRDLIRSLLKKNNFCKLQASVYISPFELNREGVDYLNKSGLLEYIRIIKVEEMDNDKDLLKKFNLKK